MVASRKILGFLCWLEAQTVFTGQKIVENSVNYLVFVNNSSLFQRLYFISRNF